MSSAIRRSAVRVACLWSLILGASVVTVLAQPAVTLIKPISTISGTGSPGVPAGNPTPASSSSLEGPIALTLDAAGNIYFSDGEYNVVWKITKSTGIMAIFAGQPGGSGNSGDGGAATSAKFRGPEGLKLDSAGDLYIIDSGNYSVRRVDAVTGIITTVVGTPHTTGYTGDGGPATAATLGGPSYLAFDSVGNLYISDLINNAIRRVDATTQIITTIAGNGTAGFTGDGGLATAATLHSPNGLNFDAAGNLYFADKGNNAIREIVAATGIINTVAGSNVGTAGSTGDGGAATGALLSNPWSVQVDSSGNLYIADFSNAAIREVNAANGVITTAVGINGTAGYSGDGGSATSAELNNPADIAFDSAGNLYLVDLVNATLREVAAIPVFPATPVATLTPAQNFFLEINTAASISSITVPLSQGGAQEYNVGSISGCIVNGTTVNPIGTVCIVPVRFSPGYPGLRGVPLVVATSAGTVNIAMIGTGLGPQAGFTPALITTPVAIDSFVQYPNGEAVDAAGNLYISDVGEVVLRVDALTQTVTTFAGTANSAGYSGDGGAATSAQLNYPSGLAVDDAGNLYIADHTNQSIRRVDSGSGIISTVAGSDASIGYSGDGGLATSSRLNNPTDEALDSAGNLYIVDSLNSVIRQVNATSGIIDTFAGNGDCGYFGDGFPDSGNTTGICQPVQATLDAAGNLYIADTGNNVIRKLAAGTGIVTTVAGFPSATAGNPGTAGYSGDGGLATAAELNGPEGVVLDTAGNLYITDSGNNVVREVNALTGIITTIAGSPLNAPGNYGYSGDGGPATAAFLSSPIFPAIDAAGNLYLTDFQNNVLRKIGGIPPFNFGSLRVGTSSTAQDLTLTNNGNVALTLTALDLPASPQFNLNGADTTCTATTSLNPAQSCVLGIIFAPTATGVQSQTLAIMDNQGTQLVTLNGTGASQSTTTTTLTLAPNPPVVGGTVDLIATVSPIPAGTPLGTVEFFNGATSLGTSAVDASGVATFEITGIAAASYTWTAAYSGNTLDTASTSAPVTVVVAAAIVTTTTLAVTPSATVNAGTVVTFTGTVLNGGAPVFPGTIFFCDATAPRCDGAAIFGSAQLNSSGVGVFKFIPGVGSYSVEAVYAGVGTDGGSVSAPQTITVNGIANYVSFTSIGATGAPGNYTLTGTVGAFGVVPPAGTVTFLNTTASTTVGMQTLDPTTLGTGFIAATNSPISQSSISWEATGDFNGDGIPDLVVVNSNYSGSIDVMLGMGDGTFAAAVPYSAGSYPQFVTVADLNHDGKPDLIVANTVDNNVEVMLGVGDGTFNAGVTYATGSNPQSIAIGDLNGDGIPDLVVTSDEDNAVSVLLGVGDGTFQAQVVYPTGGQASGAAIGDFNNDGFVDIAVANSTDSGTDTGTLSMLFGIGDGTFQPAQTLILPTGVNPSNPVAVDLRKNGTLDLVFPSAQREEALTWVMLGNNDGTFATPVSYTAQFGAVSVSVADMNNDGILDLVVPNAGGDDNGTVVSVLPGVGDGTFGPRADYPIGSTGPSAAVIADFNGDGLMDISTPDGGNSDAAVLLQYKFKTATITGVVIPGPAASQLVDASYSGDATHAGSVSTTTALSPLLTTTTLSGAPNPAVTGAAVTLTATVLTTSGTPTGTVSFYNGSTLLGSGTVSGGIATYTTAALAGRDLLTAVYSGDPVYGGSTSPPFIEAVGAQTVIVLSVSSTTVTAGTPLTLTAAVTPNPGSTPPPSGQVTFNYQQTVNGVLRNGTFGPVSLNNLGVGVWKFVPGAGSYTITATFSGTAADIPVTSAPQTVAVAAAAIFGSSTVLTPTTIAPNNYTLVGSVSAFGQVAPSGLVTFTDTTNSTAVGSASLDLATLTHSMVQAAGSPITNLPEPIFVTTGDVNGDGIPDLVTALLMGDETGYISVQLGIGDGTFQPLGPQASWYQLAGTPSAIAIADMNGDGKPDLVVADSSGAGILLGNGDGTFAAENFVSAGQGNATFVVAADLNGDGKLDLALAFTGGPVVLLGNGDGTFGPPIQYPAGVGQEGLAVADFNHDGIPDLIESNRDTDTLSLLLGVGDGTFQAATTITVPATYPALLTTADLRHNGFQDVIVPDGDSTNIYILLGNNDGTFQPAVAYPVSTSAFQVLAGDMNNDGILDLVAATPNFGLNATVGILPGVGDGTFGTEVNYATGLITISVALGDFNGDGLLDFATADAEGGSSTIYLQQQTTTATATNISLNGAGNHNVVGGYAGDASRTASQSAPVVLTGLAQTTTTTVLTFAPDPVYAGQTVVFTATISPVPTGTPLGTVSFYSGSTLFGTGTVNASGIATFTVTNVPLGSGTVDAVYSGNPLFATSTSASVTETVTLPPTTTTLTASTLTPAFGANVTFTATISPVPTGVPLGTVSFYNGATLLGNVAVNSSGVATFSTAALPSGAQSITAVYSGNTTLAASTSAPITEQVAAAGATATVATLASSNLAPVAGTNVTFTVTIAPVPTGTPLGTVSFFNGATLLGSGAVNSAGTATLTTILPAGTDVITAVYSGNTGFASTTSAPITEQVSGTATATTVTSSNLTPAFGANVTFTVTVTPAPTGTPLGSVGFYDGTTLLGTANVNSAGVATFSITSLPAGTDVITAVFSGNATFVTSTSAPITEHVSAAGAAATTATLTASPATATFGQAVTLTVTISPVPTGSPLGSVSYYNGTTLLNTATVNNSGIATFTTNSLPAGTDVLTAIYSGNASDGSSTSAADSFVVARAATTTTLAASPAIQLATMPITFTAQLASTSAGVETGNFSFLDGTTVIGTVAVAANGQAVFTTTTLGDGVHSITVSYSGDGSFLPSTSSGTPTSITIADVNLNLGGDNNKTVAPGAAVTYNFPLSPLVTPTFLYAVTLTASGLPPGATYTFTPSSIPAGAGTTQIAFTIQTAAATAMQRRIPLHGSLLRFALGFGLLLPLAGIKRFRKNLQGTPRWLLLLFAAALSIGAMTGISSCGGGFAGPPPLPAQTSYTITVTATSGTLMRSSTVQLNIQ